MNRYYSIDEEFSGLNPFENDLLSIGMVEVINKDNNFYIDPTKKFYIELKPNTGKFEEEAMKINRLNLKNLETYGATPEFACREILKFMNLKPEDTAVFIGYCGVLDKIFMDKLFYLAKQPMPFNYEIIEIGSLAIGKLNFQWGFTEKTLDNYLKIDALSENKKHNALSDAIHQAYQFIKLMQ